MTVNGALPVNVVKKIGRILCCLMLAGAIDAFSAVNKSTPSLPLEMRCKAYNRLHRYSQIYYVSECS